jgi:hypothetical protein
MAEMSETDGAWAGKNLIYILKSDGKAITGKVISKFGEGWISEGKMDGQNISFIVKMGQSTIKSSGTLSGDLINMIQMNGYETSTFTVRRVGVK